MHKEQISYELIPLQYSVTKNSDTCSQNLKLTPAVNQKFFALIINTAEYNEKMDCELDSAPDYIKGLFSKKRKASPYFKSGSYNLQIAEIINNIFTNEDKDLIRRNAIEGEVYSLISQQLKNFNQEDKREKKSILSSQFDVDQILKAKEVLIEDIVNPPTIVELAKRVGINQQKLKKGFKEIFGSTINKYLRNHRMEEARLLILSGASSLNNVAQSIGYTNASHFSRRFKEKFGVLPKDYRKSIKSQISVPGSSNQ